MFAIVMQHALRHFFLGAQQSEKATAREWKDLSWYIKFKEMQIQLSLRQVNLSWPKELKSGCTVKAAWLTAFRG